MTSEETNANNIVVSCTTKRDDSAPPPPPPLYSNDQWIPIGIGNYYKGQWNHRTMSGNGVYVMPDRTAVYKGDFVDGLFHGEGTMYYASGSRVEGVWENGKCKTRNYIFSDGLRFRRNDWQYCRPPDRRFAIEHTDGLKPAAKSHITNQPSTIKVPDGLYDAGDGFYHPLTNTVHNYWSNALIRIPTKEGGKWIMENCRPGGKRIAGYRPEYYEYLNKTKNDNIEVQNIISHQTDNSDQLIMADIKSVPSSIYDLSHQNIQSTRGIYYDSPSSSSSSSTPSSSSQSSATN